jgi:integrase
MRVLLTDRFCDRAKAGEWFDEKATGLSLRVGLKRRTWCLHSTVAGHRRRETIGRYPAMSLAAARARVLMGTAEGVQSVAMVFEDYMAREGASLRTASDRRSLFERLILPVIGLRPIGEVRRSEIVAMLDGIEDRNGTRTADTALAHLSKLFNWHAARADDFRSPIVRGMGRYDAAPRDRVLTDEELRALWSATAEGPFNRLVRFLLLTAVRREEAAQATTAEIADGVWTIPAERYKTGIDHVVPLSSAAMQCLPQASGYLFAYSGPPMTNFSRRKGQLDAASGVTDWVPHDLRRTARSLMSRAGVSADIAERCLGHVIGGVRGTYDRHSYLEEKRSAFEALATLLRQIVTTLEKDEKGA